MLTAPYMRDLGAALDLLAKNARMFAVCDGMPKDRKEALGKRCLASKPVEPGAFSPRKGDAHHARVTVWAGEFHNPLRGGIPKHLVILNDKEILYAGVCRGAAVMKGMTFMSSRFDISVEMRPEGGETQ